MKSLFKKLTNYILTLIKPKKFEPQKENFEHVDSDWDQHNDNISFWTIGGHVDVSAAAENGC